MKWNLKEKHWFPIKQLVGRGIIQESPTRRPYTVVKMSFATHQGRYNMYILFLKKKDYSLDYVIYIFLKSNKNPFPTEPYDR